MNKKTFKRNIKSVFEAKPSDFAVNNGLMMHIQAADSSKIRTITKANAVEVIDEITKNTK